MNFWHNFKKILGIAPKYLCDTCRYDYPAACKNPLRPNVVSCKDYKRK